MKTLIEAFLLFLPAGIANMTPVLANKVPRLNRWQTPMDFGRSFQGKRIFGTHKTWRGFLSGVVGGTLAGALLHVGGYHASVVSGFGEYLLFCAAISAGTLIGDAVKSFFKRRAGVSSGSSWFPFDQIDFIVGSLIFMLPFGLPPLKIIICIFILYAGLTMLASYLGFLGGLKKKPI
jgi:CDP-2,3-bis-(O-geranylgeranyl)-sn-glycerol synthase